MRGWILRRFPGAWFLRRLRVTMEHVDTLTTDPYVKWWNVAALLRVGRGDRTSLDIECPVAEGNEDEDLSGSMLSNKYQLLRRRGVGGMGNVYEARNTLIDRKVAIKVLHRIAAGKVAGARRFHREAIAAARTRHPNIVDVYDMGHTPDGRPYLVMELLEGEDLHAVLGHSRRLFVEISLAIIDQVLAGLGAAHRAGIVHRDLKPENVFLTEDQEDCPRVKLLDFGAAQLDDADGSRSRLTREGAVVGTPWYMAPEQAVGRPVDHRADLYAAGVLLFEMLSGRLPHPSRTRREAMVAVASQAPVRLETVAPG